MAEKPTLLIEIDHPELSEPLCLMSGSTFEVLRKDMTGLEIYGMTHQGKEYLLFPMEFRPLDAGILGLGMPSEYREWFLERNVEGARIVFGAPHGTPFFPDMPEEYRSSAGTLRLTPTGEFKVELDRVEPGGHAFGHDEECGDGPCSCGHDHPHVHGHASEHAHKRKHGHECAHGHDEAAPHAMSDKDLANAIRVRARALNELLDLAHKAGLVVELALEPDSGSTRPAGSRNGPRLVFVDGIFKPL